MSAVGGADMAARTRQGQKNVRRCTVVWDPKCTPAAHLFHNGPLIGRSSSRLNSFRRRSLLSFSTRMRFSSPWLKKQVRRTSAPVFKYANHLMFSGEQDASHVPTADRVLQIFQHSNPAPNSSELPSDAELPEIDFMDLGKIMNEIEVLEAEAASSKNATATRGEKAEDQTTIMAVDEPFMGFRIDTNPSPVRDTPANHIPVEHPGIHILGEDIEDDDEIIVYVAPNPRKGVRSSSPIQSSSTAAATIPPPTGSEPVSRQVHQGTYGPPSTTTSPPEPTLEPIPTPSPPISSPAETSRNAANPVLSKSSKLARRALRPHRVSKRRKKRHVTFSSFGAIRAETALREVDPRRDEQRRGDSDVDWGVSASEGSVEDGGMEVDNDMDIHTMKTFVEGMSISGSAHVTAEDLAEDEERSYEGGPASDGSSNEDDEELELADDVPNLLTSEEEDDPTLGDGLVASEDESTSDEEGPPRSFQARLDKLRKRTEGRPIKDLLKDELDGELDDDDDDSLIAQIQVTRSCLPVSSAPLIHSLQDFIDDNDEILRRRDRKQRNRIFEAIQHGSFEYEMDFADRPARACFYCAASFLVLMHEAICIGCKKNKDKDLPKELQEQWERDRAKKAERKHLRALEKLAAALDPFVTKKGGKKARKARLAAALASPMSLETVVERMRRFVADLGGAQTHTLPPMDPKTRKSVHDLAHAFKLESKSQNHGAARFTTLKKKPLSGICVDEKAIRRILGRPSYYEAHEGGKGKDKAVRIRPRDGERVGEVRFWNSLTLVLVYLLSYSLKAAPKLDGSNIGFQMLSAMGWVEGGRIGVVGGLEAPLVAVIKTTKLGLGANRSSGRSKK